MVHDSTQALTPRQRRREARTSALVDHALEIVVDGGLDALTMPGLAKAAGAAVGALYRYFDSKDALLVALQVRGIEALAEVLAQALAGVDASGKREVVALRRVHVAVGAWARFAATHPELYRLVDGSLSDPAPQLSDDDARAVHEALAPVLDVIAELLDDAVEEGALAPGDAAVRTHALWAAAHGVQHFAKRDRVMPPSLHAASVRNLLVDTLLMGWGAPRGWVVDARPSDA